MAINSEHMLYEGSHSFIFVDKLLEGRPAVIKVLKTSSPSIQETVQFNNEYDFTHELNISGIRKALKKTQYHHQSALVLDYIEGQTLKHYVDGSSLNWKKYLEISIHLSQILGELHQHGLIHKDINPANILIESSSLKPWIIDFGISAQWGMNIRHMENPNHLEGTLAYISPEQTGRMNRMTDFRSDLYSFGVTLYELFTQQLPFEAEDSIGWVHAHIAKHPTPPHEINPEIPLMLSEIILKLMAKNAEDRYQSAFGLKYDLELVMNNQESFPLGQEDFSSRFQIPQKLYGRDLEIKQLLDTFERASTGSMELMLISGYSGVGKSALVYQTHQPITAKKGYFISGKFDQFQRNIPYSVFTQAFNQLCDYLLTETEEKIARWRQRVLEAVGNNGQVLIDIIPHLEYIIGPQPTIPELAPQESQNRFNLYFAYFVQAIGAKEHPLVIFIDDLQWADLASLELLKLMFSEQYHHCLIIGAFRDNEIHPKHPFSLSIDEIKESGALVNQVHLGNLAYEHVSQLIDDTLHTKLNSSELVDLIYSKTHGNAFFVNQFLQTLAEEQLVNYNLKTRHWEWDIERIRAKDITDNVVDFLSDKISNLPEKTCEIIKLAACIGNQFELSTLIGSSDYGEQESALALQEALKEGLLTPIQDIYHLRGLMLTDAHQVNEYYKFVHDRVQQAAYSLLNTPEKQAYHLKIGQLIYGQVKENDLEDSLFDIIEHFHLALPLVNEQSQKLQIARLSLQTGIRAKMSAAYESAFNYLKTALSCLPQNSWDSEYLLTLNLYVEAVECAYISGNFSQMDEWSKIVLEKGQSLLDKTKVYEIKITSHLAKYQLEEAVSNGLEILKLLGISLPLNPEVSDLQAGLGEAFQKIGTQSPDDLMILPESTDPNILAAIHLMVYINLPAYLFRPLLYPLLVAKEISLMTEHGNVPESPFVYATFAMILCGVVGNIELGYQFGAVSQQLLLKPGAKPVESRTLLVLGNGVLHWKDSIWDYIDLYMESYKKGLETGDLEFVGQAVHSYCFSAYFIGMELSRVDREMSHYENINEKLKASTALNYLRMYHQSLLNLTQPSDNPCLLIGDIYDETTMLAIHEDAKDRTAIFVLYFSKILVSYIFERYEESGQYAEIAEEHIDAVTALTHVPIFHCYDSLIQLALYTSYDENKQKEIIEKVKSNQAKLKEWASHAPANYEHKYYLVEAELCRVSEQFKLATEYYEKAIELAKKHRYLNDEAIANERFGLFWLSLDHQKIAALYLKEAHLLYKRWGALEKVKDLEKKHPEFFARMSHPIEWQTHSITTSKNEAQFKLDYLTLLKSTRAISQQINLESLLEQLLQLILENAGAERGYLILPQDQELYIEAFNDTSGESQILTHIPIKNQEIIPQSVVQFVLRTGGDLVLNDAASDERFAKDDLIRSRKIKSLLCLAIKHQGQMAMILYLENSLLTHVFTPSRLNLLNILLSQAAISLENARLYHSLEEQVRHRTHELSQTLEHLKSTQQELVQSEKMAVLGQLVAGLAHEINNPINFISNSLKGLTLNLKDLELLLQSYSTLTSQNVDQKLVEINQLKEELNYELLLEELVQLPEGVNEGIIRTTEIIEGLKLFSRVDKAEKERSNIHENLDSTLILLQSQLPEHVCVEKHFQLTEPEIDCFPGKLKQVFLNILVNAIQSIQDSSSATITIETGTESSTHVYIKFTDTGVGMTQEVQKHLFEPFFTTKDVGQGTGLGMSISHGIIEEHQGTIEVESQIGEGTCFKIVLPIHSSHDLNSRADGMKCQ